MASAWFCRFAFAVLGVLTLAGCSSEEEPPPSCVFPDRPPRLATQPGIILVGQQVTLKVTPSILSCSGQEVPHPTSVTAEVEGPDGEPVTSQIELGALNAPAILQFTPLRPGPHHLLVSFSQVGGLHQFDLQAAQDLSAEASTASLLTRCDSLERTLQGAWVCDTKVVRDGALVGAFSGARLAVSGDVIWVVDGSTVRRYLDTGTTLTLTGSGPQQRAGIEFFLATSDELVVLHTTAIVLYTFKEGGVTAGGSEPWTRPGLDIGLYGGVLLREGEYLAVLTRALTGTEFIIQLCPYQLVSGRFRRTTGGCQQLPGGLAGHEPGVLWTMGPPRVMDGSSAVGIIRRWLWAGGQLEEQGSLSRDPRVLFLSQPSRRMAAVPVLYSFMIPSDPAIFTVLRWSPERKMLFLEHLDTEINKPYATPSFYWGQRLQAPEDAPTKVRIRPPG